MQIKPNALTALGIGIDQVIDAIRAANQDVPAGRLTHGASDAMVRVEGKIKDPAHSAASSSRSRAARRSTCRRSPTSSTARRRRPRSRAINGRPSITLDVQKAQDANIVETGAASGRRSRS